MQTVKVWVVVQSFVIAALAMAALRTGDLAPPNLAAESGPTRSAPPPTTAHADLPTTAIGTVDPNHRTAAPSSSPASASVVVLHGSLRGIDPPPKGNIVSIQCRRDGEERSANVDDSGHFAIPGLTPGAWLLSCEVEGCRKLAAELELTSAPLQRLDLDLVAATMLTVFVKTSTGGRLQSAMAKAGLRPLLQVVATAAPKTGELPALGSSLSRHRRSRETHDLEDENANDGVLELDQPPPVFAALLFGHVVLAEQRIEPGQHELHFQVDFAAVQSRLAKVRFRVVDEAGQPLAKVIVELQSAQGGGGDQSTAEDGTAALQDVVPGVLQLELRTKDREDLTTHVFVIPGADLDLGDLVLHPAVNLRGVVRDSAGKPVAAFVYWTDLDLWRPPQPMNSLGTRADGDGNFQVHRAGPKRYSVCARTDDGRIGHAVADARSLAAAPLQIVVGATTTVQLQVQDAGLTTWVVVRDRDGNPIEVSRIWWQGSVRLPPGDYRLDSYADERTLLRSQDLVVGTTKLRVELP